MAPAQALLPLPFPLGKGRDKDRARLQSFPKGGGLAALDIAALLPPGAWSSLPACLRRRFAAGHGAADYPGTMDLHLSRVGLVFAWALRLFGAPLPLRGAADVPVAVSVRPTAAGVLWERRIGRQTVRSVKSPGPDGTVLERTEGGLGMVLRVSAADGALVFTSQGFFLSLGRWRLPVPGLLTPGRCRVEHRALGATRFRFTLTMTHPLWGTTVRQDGTFTDMPEGYQT